jgi:peptidoglycan/LPS O-acetylase OafA/YrhL
MKVARGERFPELDSLRGLAAVVVVLHHFKLMFYRGALTTGLPSLIAYPFTAGHEAVTLFFVLSGFVLSLPYLRRKERPYFVFLIRRVLRIYGPYLAALLLSVVGCFVWHNNTGVGTWSNPVTTVSLLQPIAFIGNYDFFRYNTAFWSLVYEMRVSIIFPVLALIAVNLRARWVLLLIVVCTYNARTVPILTVECAGIFIGGLLLAKHIATLGAAYRRLAKWQRVLCAALSFALYNEGHLLVRTALWHLGYLPVSVGAAGLIVVALFSNTVSRFLQNPVPEFLGKISYSVYLVHGTVLYALARSLGGRISHPALFMIYLPTALLLSWCFHTAVEAPFLRMSRAVKKKKSVLASVVA